MPVMKLMVILSSFGLIAGDKFVKLYNIVCEPSQKWTENATCELKVVGRNMVVANMEMDSKRPFRNISVHLKVFKFYNQFRPFLVDITFNACDVFKKRGKSNFFSNLVVRILSKYSNAVKCPLHGHIYARKLEIKYEYLKIFVEEGKYRLNFEFFEGFPMDLLGKVTIYGEVINQYNKPSKKTGKLNKINYGMGFIE